MKLKDLLQWEVPQAPPWGGATATPNFWIIKSTAASYSYKIAVNRRWVEENEPQLAKRVPKDSAKKGTQTYDVGVSVSIDREKKEFRCVFAPPAELPQFMAKHNVDKSGTITIMNKVLGEDLWLLMEMPQKAHKQYFKFEVEKEVEGKKVYRVWYDPQMAQNMNALLAGNKEK